MKLSPLPEFAPAKVPHILGKFGQHSRVARQMFTSRSPISRQSSTMFRRFPMSMPFALPFPMPGDEDSLRAAMARPGGLLAVPAAEMAFLGRAVAGLDLLPLVQLAEAAQDDAAVLYEFWLGVHGTLPQSCAAWFNLGVMRMKAHAPARAAEAYRTALRLKPDMVEAAINLGSALEAAGQTDAALAAWRTALPAPSLRQILHNQLGRVMESEGRLGPASEELRASLLISPDQPDVQQHLLHIRQRTTAWPVTALNVPGITPAEAAFHCGPLAALALYNDPMQQAASSADWIARKVPPAPAHLAPPQGYAHDRIRIGYLSTDFCRHAMSFLIAELLELHDRSRFEVYGYDASPEDGSPIRARVLDALDHHIPIHTLTDEAAARRMAADEIDILIDLNGLTKGARLGILRWKPAPVMATYLGYIGPVPMPELDYILCDAVTIPPEAEAGYTPRPLRIEGCYQANDSRAPTLPPVSRAAEGLPEAAFVYTCVSHHYKLTEQIWDCWSQILEGTQNSVLWLIDDNPESKAALTTRWAARGLAPERLIFAPRVDPDRYRARLALADLFLDTHPYNAGTIASDALRMGLPMVTLQGKAFAARMASSLLTAVGLTEGIATTPWDYVQIAIALCHDRASHARMKAHLAGDAWARTLGDAAGFTRRFEAAMERVRLHPTAPG
jgi:predicted O-linked N-acetylglucosamine transferase (SPINDLY family)